MREANQYAADLIYRFTDEKESFWIGPWYNALTATLRGLANDIVINRFTLDRLDGL